MSCPIKACQNICNIGRYWLFLVFLVLSIGISVFNLNHMLFLKINAMHVILPDTAWEVINYIAYPRHFILTVILLLATVLLKRDKLFRVILLLAVYYIGFFALKKFFGEARPFILLPEGSFHWLNQLEKVSGREYMSFPSGHAGLAAVFAFGLSGLFFPKNRFFQLVLFVFLIFVCLARVCTGWHWPLDVIVSGLIGYVLVKICFCGCPKSKK